MNWITITQEASENQEVGRKNQEKIELHKGREKTVRAKPNMKRKNLTLLFNITTEERGILGRCETNVGKRVEWRDFQ